MTSTVKSLAHLSNASWTEQLQFERLASVSPTSAQGGTVATSGPWVFYTPPGGFTNSDSFTYVIADSGALQATGSVSIARL